MLVLYAQWTNVQYRVTFDGHGATGGTMADQEFGYGDAEYLATNCFVREGYAFTGWNTDPDGSGEFYEDGAEGSTIPAEQDETVVLYAQWRRNAYTVKFLPGAGTGTMADQVFEVGVAQKLSDNAFEYEGHEFLGWTNRVAGGAIYANGQQVRDLADEDGAVVRLNAVWDSNTFTVRFDANGGGGDAMEDQEFQYGESDRLRENSYTNANHTFVEWNTARDGSGVAYADGADGSRISQYAGDVVTLYAQWRRDRYLVRFDGHGATSGAMADQEFEYGYEQRLTQNAYGKTGYLFSHWNTKADGTGTNYVNHAKVTNPHNAESELEDGGMLVLYAQWTNISYRVEFNANGGTGTMSGQTLGYGGSEFLNTNEFVWTNHAFVEWNTLPDGSGDAYADGAVGTLIPALYDGDTVNLYAQWRWNIYSVRFNPTGGTGTMADQEFEFNERKQLAPNAFTYSGHDFLGWTNRIDGTTYEDKQFVINLTNEDGRVVNLYAVWDSHGFKVKFNKNDDEAEGTMADQTFEYGASTRLTENEFHLTNHTFVAWNTTRDGSGVSYADKSDGSMITDIDGDIVTLYAQWRLNRYRVRFNPNGGAGSMDDQEFEWGYTQRLSRCTFTKFGTKFNGWSLEPGGSVKYLDNAKVGNLASEDDAIVNLYAKWDTYEFNVRLDPNGGTWTGGEGGESVTNLTFTYGAYGNLPVNDFFEKDKMTFVEWNTAPDGSGAAYADGANGSMIVASENENVTLYAQWRKNRYTVEYDANGGDGKMEPDTFVVGEFPHRFKKCSFDAAGGQFLGWTTNTNVRTPQFTDQGRISYDLTEEDGVTVTLYAIWDANKYTVVFDPGEGGEAPSGIHTQEFVYGTSKRLSENDYTRTNHVFDSWNTHADGSGTSYADRAVGSRITTKPNDWVTLFAQWRPNRYYVKFNAHGGDGEMDDQEFEHDDGHTLARNTFTRPGYEFDHWSGKTNGVEQTFEDAAYVINPGSRDGETVNLYAEWKANSYKVRFDRNGGDTEGGDMAVQDFTYGGTTNLLTNAYTKAWHTFVEWNTEPDGSGEGYEDGANGSRIVPPADGDTVTLYAIWRPNAYTVRFHPRGGSGTMADQEFEVNTSERLSRNLFTAEGKEFLGWVTNKYASATTDVNYVDRQYVMNLATNDGEIVTLYAKWNANSFTVNFDSNSSDALPENGAMPETNFLYGTSQRLPTNIYTRTTHSFKEWNTYPDGSGNSYADGTIGSTITSVDGEQVTLYAQWRPNIYTVVFAPNGGTEGEDGKMEPEDFEYGESKRLTRNTFVRTGYVFKNWNNDPAGTNVVFNDMQAVVNLCEKDGDLYILYAQWTPNEYTVVFDQNCDDADGDMANQKFTYGQTQKLTANAYTRVGYTFSGWNTEPDGTGDAYANGAVGSRIDAVGLVTLYAQWIPNTYTVAFDANDGSGEITTQEFTYDVLQRLDRNPFTWSGHIFLGWNSIWSGGGMEFADREWVENLSAEDGDIVTLYAQWEDAAYTVVYYPNGGTGIMKEQEISYNSGQRLTLNTFTRTGWSFTGWNTEADGSGRSYRDGANGSTITTLKGVTVGLYAQWSPNTYVVRFDKNSSAAIGSMSDQEFTYGEATNLTANAFRLEGQLFNGWTNSTGAAFADREAVSNLTEEAGATVTLYAKWRGTTYSVHYDKNSDEATGSMGDKPCNYDTTQRLDKNVYSRYGYAFGGWNTKADGSGVTYIDMGDYYRSAADAVGGDENDVVTLYAMWKGVPYTVVYDKNGATSGTMEDETFTYGTVTNLAENAYAKVVDGTNMIFTGWATNGTDEVVFEDGAEVFNLATNSITLVAQWTNDVEYIIAFDANGGEGEMAKILGMHYNQATNLPPNAFTRADYTFVDWELDDGSHVEDTATVSNLTVKSGTTVWLRANWKRGAFFVEFNSNEGDDSSVVTQTFAFGEAKPLLANTFTRGGKFTFQGWNTNEASTVSGLYDDEQVVSDASFDPAPTTNATITLYANWHDDRLSDLSKAMHCYELEWELVSILNDDEGHPITNTDWMNRGPGANAQAWTTNYSDTAGYDPSGSCVVTTNILDGMVVSGMVMCAEVTTNGTISLQYKNTSSGTYSLVLSYSDTKNELFVGDEWEMQKMPSTGDEWKPFEIHVALPEGATNAYLHIGFVGTSGEAQIDQVKWTPDLPKSGLVRGRSVDAKSARLRNLAVETPVDEADAEQDEAVIPGEGKVTTPRTWKTGQTVTWKAVPAKGSVFSHWEGRFVATLGLSWNEQRSPSLKFKVPEGFKADDIKAVFVSFDSDSLGNIVLNGSLQVGVNASGVRLIDDSASYVTATLRGLPSGLKFNAKTLELTGAPKKSGVFKVKLSAKNASGYRYSDTLVLKVADANGVFPVANRTSGTAQAAWHPLTVIAAGDGVGTVSGTGVYAAGRKASISAKAAKGYVFAGWYRDAELTDPMAFASGDFRKASQAVVVPEVRYLYARFVRSGAAQDPITGLAATGSSFDKAEGAFKWRVGVALPDDDGIVLESASLPTCSASGLPAGVKFDSALRRFTGVPTKAGEFSAKVKVKNVSGAVAELSVKVRVSALDAWAKGSFSGAALDGDEVSGVVQSLTVSSAGKLSGKIVMGDLSYTLSAPSYSSYDGETGTYAALVVCKSGKIVVTNRIEVAAETVKTPDGGGMVRGRLDGDSFTAWQNVWKDAAWKSEAKIMAKAPAKTFELDDHSTLAVTVKFGASGAVTAKCLGRSCTATLVPDAADPSFYSAYFYFPPKAGEDLGFAVWADMQWDGVEFK